MKTVEITYIKDPERRKAYLVTSGPEASVIRFVHSGQEQCISNKFILENKSKTPT